MGTSRSTSHAELRSVLLSKCFSAYVGMAEYIVDEHICGLPECMTTTDKVLCVGDCLLKLRRILNQPIQPWVLYDIEPGQFLMFCGKLRPYHVLMQPRRIITRGRMGFERVIHPRQLLLPVDRYEVRAYRVCNDIDDLIRVLNNNMYGWTQGVVWGLERLRSNSATQNHIIRKQAEQIRQLKAQLSQIIDHKE
jgi:hypothetical protein